MSTLRLRLVACLGVAAASFGCSAPVCGTITITGIEPNPELSRWLKPDGSLGLIDVCGNERGAFALARGDLKLTTIIFDTNVPEDVTTTEASPIARIVLPVASIVLWDANLVKGKTLTMRELYGTALQKRTEAELYRVYPLTKATITVLDGPLDHVEEKLIDTVDWHESWKLKWSLEFGGGVQKHEGEDLVQRSRGTEVGTPAFYPPDPKP